MSFVGQNWKNLLGSQPSKKRTIPRSEPTKPVVVKKVKSAVSESISELPSLSSLDKKANPYVVASLKPVKDHKKRADRSAAPKVVKPEETVAVVVNSAPGSIGLDLETLPSKNIPVAMDCESVILLGNHYSIARVCITSVEGKVLYDRFIQQKEKVADFRAAITGLKLADIKSSQAIDFQVAMKEIYSIIKDRLVIGYGLVQDLKLLSLRHEPCLIRDISTYKPFMLHHKKRLLVSLAHEKLGTQISHHAVNSVEDARISMKLYMLEKDAWESFVEVKYGLRLKEIRKRVAVEEMRTVKNKQAQEQSKINRKARQAKRAERRRLTGGNGRWLVDSKESGDDSDNETVSKTEVKSNTKYDNDSDSDSD